MTTKIFKNCKESIEFILWTIKEKYTSKQILCIDRYVQNPHIEQSKMLHLWLQMHWQQEASVQILYFIDFCFPGRGTQNSGRCFHRRNRWNHPVAEQCPHDLDAQHRKRDHQQERSAAQYLVLTRHIAAETDHRWYLWLLSISIHLFEICNYFDIYLFFQKSLVFWMQDCRFLWIKK